MVVVMRTEKKVSEETGYGRAGSPAEQQCNGRLSCVTQQQAFPHLDQAPVPRGDPGNTKTPNPEKAAFQRNSDPHKSRRRRAEQTPATEQRLKILRLRLALVVLIRWLKAGQRLEETVPYQQARHRRLELEAEGAVVYWSERLEYHR